MNATRCASTPRLLALALVRRPWATLVVLLGLLYLPWLAALPLDGTLEGNRLQAAREMLATGDWIVPRLNGELYLAKPPLHPWTIALAALPFGDVCLMIGRGVSVLAALGTCFLILAWGRRELGRRIGLFAALAAGGCVLLAEKAMRAELELPLTFLTTLAVLGLWEAGHARDAGRRRARALVAGLALGGAVLVKGPPPLLVFLAVAIVLALRRESRRAFLGPALVALVLAAGCVLAWIVPLSLRLGFDTLWQAFDAQFLQRLSNAGRTNVEPFWYYLPAIAIALLPATLAAPCLGQVGPRSVPERRRPTSVFLWAWALLPLLLFSFSSGKESRYLLPTVPAWALLLAWGWTRARARGSFPRWRRGLGRTLALAGWIAPPLWLVVAGVLLPESLVAITLSAALGLAARAACAWPATRRPGALLAALALGLFAGKLAWAGSALAVKREQIPVAEIARTIDAELAPGEAWILLGPYRSWWHFPVDRPCLSVLEWSDLARARAGSAQRADLLLAPENRLPEGLAPEVRSGSGLRELGRWTVDGDAYRLLRFER